MRQSPTETNIEYLGNDILNLTSMNEEKEKESDPRTAYALKFADVSTTKDINSIKQQIDDIFKMFDGKIGKLLQNHEKDFMLAYKDQMGQV